MTEIIQFKNVISHFEKLILGELKNEKITCWVAGGAVRDYFMGVVIHTDYDLFFPNKLNYDKAYSYLNDVGGEIKWESANGCKIVYKNRTFDLVKKFFDDPQSTIEAFDYTVSMFAVDTKSLFWGNSIYRSSKKTTNDK